MSYALANEINYTAFTFYSVYVLEVASTVLDSVLAKTRWQRKIRVPIKRSRMNSERKEEKQKGIVLWKLKKNQL